MESIFWESVKRINRISSLMVLGKWVSDSDDSRLAKAEVQAAAGEHPVALGPSGHWNNHDASDNVPLPTATASDLSGRPQFQSPDTELAPMAYPEHHLIHSRFGWSHSLLIKNTALTPLPPALLKFSATSGSSRFAQQVPQYN